MKILEIKRGQRLLESIKSSLFDFDIVQKYICSGRIQKSVNWIFNWALLLFFAAPEMDFYEFFCRFSERFFSAKREEEIFIIWIIK